MCPRCLDQAHPIDGRPITKVEVDGMLLDVLASFCYLGDMLCAGGGCALTLGKVSEPTSNTDFQAYVTCDLKKSA